MRYRAPPDYYSCFLHTHYVSCMHCIYDNCMICTLPVNTNEKRTIKYRHHE